MKGADADAYVFTEDARVRVRQSASIYIALSPHCRHYNMPYTHSRHACSLFCSMLLCQQYHFHYVSLLLAALMGMRAYFLYDKNNSAMTPYRQPPGRIATAAAHAAAGQPWLEHAMLRILGHRRKNLLTYISAFPLALQICYNN